MIKKISEISPMKHTAKIFFKARLVTGPNCHGWGFRHILSPHICGRGEESTFFLAVRLAGKSCQSCISTLGRICWAFGQIPRCTFPPRGIRGLTKHAQNLVEQVHDKSKLAPYNHCYDHHHQSAQTSISMLKRMSRTDSSLHIRTCGIRGVTKRVLE